MNRSTVLNAFSRDVVLYLVIWFFHNFCFFGLYTVLLNLYLLRLGYQPDFIGLANAAVAIGFAAFALPAGALGVRWGHRSTILVGLSCNVVLTGLIPLSMYLDGLWQQLTIVICYGGYGFFLTLIAVNGVAFLADSAGDEHRAVVFSVYAALNPIAAFVGSLVGGLVPAVLSRVFALSPDRPEPFGYSLWLPSIVFLTAVLIFMSAGERSRLPKRASKLSVSGAPAGLMTRVFVVNFLRATSNFGIIIFFSAYLDSRLHVPLHVIGFVVAIGRLLAAPAALLAPVIVSRLGKKRLVIAATALTALSCLPAAMVPTLAMAAISWFAVSVFFAISEPAFTTFHQEVCPPQWRSLMSGGVFTAAGLSFAAVAYGGGSLIMSVGYQRFFLLPVVAGILGAYLFWQLLARARLTNTEVV